MLIGVAIKNSPLEVNKLRQKHIGDMLLGSRDGAVVRALACHQCVPGSIPGPGVMWVEFVVGSLPCSERFFSGFFGFPLSSKTNISKFQFDLDYCQVLYHEPLARVIAQALPVFDIKFTFYIKSISTIVIPVAFAFQLP